MDERPERFRYRIVEHDGLHYLTSPDYRGLLVATVSRQDSLDAAPRTLRNFRFRRTGVLGAIPTLVMIEI